MSATITPSSANAHAIILNTKTTSNITYTTDTDKEVTYSLTGTDSDKFSIQSSSYTNDNSQLATIVLDTAANIDAQLKYDINLVATTVSGNNTTARAITIYVSSSSTDVAETTLPGLTSSASTIDELSVSSKATFTLTLPLSTDYGDIIPTFKAGSGTGYSIARNGRSIEINRTSVGIDMGDLSNTLSDDQIIILTYTDSDHNNGSAASKTYTSADITVTITYTPQDIKFLQNTTDYSSSTGGQTQITALTTDANGFYSGLNGSGLAALRRADAQTDASAQAVAIPVFLNQKCTWAIGATTGQTDDSAKFSLFSDSALSSALGAADGAHTAYIKFTPGASLLYATDKDYYFDVTLTDAGTNTGSDATKTLTTTMLLSVTSDATAPIIKLVTVNNGTEQTNGSGHTSATSPFTEDTANTTSVATFGLDTSIHGSNDPTNGVNYYLVAYDAAASGNVTSLGVQAIGDSTNTATFEITSSGGDETNAQRTGTIKFNANAPAFNQNYTAVDENQFKIGVFAQDTAGNTSAVLVLTVDIKNKTALTLQNPNDAGTNLISNGVVSAGGSTNASTISFAAITSVPELAAEAWLSAAKNGFTLTNTTDSADETSNIGTVTLSDVSHPTNSNMTVKKIVFDITSLTDGKSYTLTAPTVPPAATHQNDDDSLSGGNLQGTAAKTFSFTFTTNVAGLALNGPGSITWPRGMLYTEKHFASGTSVSSATNKELGAAPDNAGDTMAFYNAVDPTAAVGSIGYFTWTVSDSAGNKTSKTRSVTIGGTGTSYGGAGSGEHALTSYRLPAVLTQTTTGTITFGGSGSTATEPANKTFTELKAAASVSSTVNSAGDALTVSKISTAFSANDLNTLWTYVAPGNVGNATLVQTYEVSNEDVYSYNFSSNSDEANLSGSVAEGALSGSGRSDNKRTNWDKANADGGYLGIGNMQGTVTYTMVEPAGHQIDVSFSALSLSEQITTSFTLTEAATLDLTETTFDTFGTIHVTIPKNELNNVFYFKPEGNGIENFDLLPTFNSLRSETITIKNNETGWPQIKHNGATDLYDIDVQDYKSKAAFESSIPESGDKIKDIIVENWVYDIFSLPQMKSVFSSISAMETEIQNFLTSPAAGTVNTTTLDGRVRTQIASADASQPSGSNITDVKDSIGLYLLYKLHETISGNSDAHYRLTNKQGGMFHSTNKVSGGDFDGYFPFLFQAGDKLTLGITFTHGTVNTGDLFQGGSGVKTLGDLPFKIIITLS